MKNKAFLLIGFALTSIIVIVASVKSRRPAESPAGGVRKLNVVTTLFPLYDMARSIGAGKAEVSLLMPPGVEPHSFEPKPSDMARINEADIFVYTGRFMEPWAEDIIKSVSNKNLAVVDAGLGVKLAKGMGRGHAGSATAPDPHIWLDFDNAEVMAANIGAALENKDPANGVYYRRVAAAYKGRLAALDAAYKAGPRKKR